MFRWIYMPKRRLRNCCCSSVIDNSEPFSSSNPAFPIEAYSAAAARPPVNSLLFILLAFSANPVGRAPCPGSSLSQCIGPDATKPIATSGTEGRTGNHVPGGIEGSTRSETEIDKSTHGCSFCRSRREDFGELNQPPHTTESAVDASSNQRRSAAGNLQAPHGSRSATISPPGDDGGESQVVANSGKSHHSELSRVWPPVCNRSMCQRFQLRR
jgi:hypothetical protein